MGKKTDEKALAILEGGREHLKKKGVWCKGNLGETKDGRVLTDEDFFAYLTGKQTERVPHQVCALGALAMQPGCLGLRKNVGYESSVTWTKAGIKANHLLDESTDLLHPYDESTFTGPGADIVGYNDSYARRKGQIIEIYDHAIASLREKLGL